MANENLEQLRGLATEVGEVAEKLNSLINIAHGAGLRVDLRIHEIRAVGDRFGQSHIQADTYLYLPSTARRQ